nr:immunoglobulin heavy chain junction region [Macaca mulatta]MOY28758.1 immunoglobulin heavy chain junction region [Macaca mulatta]
CATAGDSQFDSW